MDSSIVEARHNHRQRKLPALHATQETILFGAEGCAQLIF